jgi:hypothetical protein
MSGHGTSSRHSSADRWATQSSSTGRWSRRAAEAVAVGLEFLILAPDGRIRLDYQFIER